MWLPTVFFGAFAVLLLVCAALSPEDPDEQRALAFTGLFLFGCTLLMYLLLRYTRLELSERGVKLYQFGYTLESPWDNVAAFYDVKRAEGLVLHRPMECKGASVLRAFRKTGTGGAVRMYNDEQVSLLADRRFIPIEAFAYWLRHGRLREDLVRHAPSAMTPAPARRLA